MVIGTSAIVFAAAAAVGVVFAFARPADARFMHQCSGKYHAAAKAGCRANAAKASAPLPRGITLGIGDVVSVTIVEPPGGLFVPSDAGARPGKLSDAAEPNSGLQRQHNSAVRRHDPSRWEDTFRSSTSDQRSSKGLASVSEREIDASHPPPDGPRIAGASRSPRLTVYKDGQPIGRIYADGWPASRRTQRAGSRCLCPPD